MTVPGRPRRAARTGLFIVAGGANFAMMDYKHSAPLEPGGDGRLWVLQTFGSAGAGRVLRTRKRHSRGELLHRAPTGESVTHRTAGGEAAKNVKTREGASQ
jgi:hypothetical protein